MKPGPRKQLSVLIPLELYQALQNWHKRAAAPWPLRPSGLETVCPSRGGGGEARLVDHSVLSGERPAAITPRASCFDMITPRPV